MDYLFNSYYSTVLVCVGGEGGEIYVIFAYCVFIVDTENKGL